MPNLYSLQFFIPELILVFVSLALILASAGRQGLRPARVQAGWSKDLPIYISITGLVLSFIFVVRQFAVGSPPLFWGLLILDKPAVFFKLIFVVTALIVIIFSAFNISAIRRSCEYYALISGAVLGMNLLAMADNILMIYLALEFVSLTSYLLVGWDKSSPKSGEAALKYVLYGAVASGVFLFGSSIYYGLTGTLDIGPLTAAFCHTSAYKMAGLFMLAGFFYKIAAVPLQAWCPDAYEGAPTPVTAFLSVAPKSAGFAVLIRVFGEIGGTLGWPIIIAAISAVTMTFGNLSAIPQNNLKRLLAYSSIAHAGYLLMGVACATAGGDKAVSFYFIAYLIMNLGAFLVVQMAGEELSSYSGLARRGGYGALIAIAMTVFLLSLTGVPPFFGFVGKFYLFSAVIDAKLYWLAIVGIINSVISLYYYMRVVKTMFFDEAVSADSFAKPDRTLTALLIILSLATVVFGLYWQWFSRLVEFVTAG